MFFISRNVAWNTFAYEAVRVDDGSRLVAQPPRVGIEVQPTPAGLASYGDYVWNDVNQNGSQDEPPYRGINGVTVRLARRRKRASHLRVVPPPPQQANER